jgi:hypothetical protein
MEQRESTQEPLMTRIGQAAILLHGGDREEARNLRGRMWTELGVSGGDPMQRSTLAHYLADTQDDPGDELAWDLRALTAAQGDDTPQSRALAPTLHVNLAADYVKLHQPAAARVHLDRARDTARALDDDRYGYRDRVRAAISRLALRLA